MHPVRLPYYCLLHFSAHATLGINMCSFFALVRNMGSCFALKKLLSYFALEALWVRFFSHDPNYLQL